MSDREGLPTGIGARSASSTRSAIACADRPLLSLLQIEPDKARRHRLVVDATSNGVANPNTVRNKDHSRNSSQAADSNLEVADSSRAAAHNLEADQHSPEVGRLHQHTLEADLPRRHSRAAV